MSEPIKRRDGPSPTPSPPAEQNAAEASETTYLSMRDPSVPLPTVPQASARETALEREVSLLQREVADLREQVSRLQVLVARLTNENEALKRQLGAAHPLRPQSRPDRQGPER